MKKKVFLFVISFLLVIGLIIFLQAGFVKAYYVSNLFEGWETVPIGNYYPGSIFVGDSGLTWLIPTSWSVNDDGHDYVSILPGKKMKMTVSAIGGGCWTGGDCANRINVLNYTFHYPLRNNTHFRLEGEGHIEYDSKTDAFITVSLALRNPSAYEGHAIRYVFQYNTDYLINQGNEIFLGDLGAIDRNVYEDFKSLFGVEPSYGYEIRGISFDVGTYKHYGIYDPPSPTFTSWAIWDNIEIVDKVPPTISIIKAEMVSPNILGIDAIVGFPSNDKLEGPRYVELKATINGQPIKEQIDVTDLVGPSETSSIQWAYTKRLQINLANAHDESGNLVTVPRFDKNEKFNLEAVAWSDTSGRSSTSQKNIEILLPVIIVHGWTGESLVASIPFRVYENLISRLTNEGYTTDPSWYKTLWFEKYNSQKWSSQYTASWLDDIVGKATSATYANQVNIIGHSLGGLIGRDYITNYPSGNKVHKLIMVGTPNKGSSQFYIQTSGWNLNSVNKKLVSSPLAQWLIPTYQALYDTENNSLVPPILNNFPDIPKPEGVGYFSIYNTAINTPYELLVSPYRGWYKVIDKEYHQIEGDGTVISESAYLDSAINKPLAVSSNHKFLTKDPVVQNTIIESLKD